MKALAAQPRDAEAHVIRPKESAGRRKYLRALPLLYRHQAARRTGMTD